MRSSKSIRNSWSDTEAGVFGLLPAGERKKLRLLLKLRAQINAVHSNQRGREPEKIVAQISNPALPNEPTSIPISQYEGYKLIRGSLHPLPSLKNLDFSIQKISDYCHVKRLITCTSLSPFSQLALGAQDEDRLIISDFRNVDLAVFC